MFFKKRKFIKLSRVGKNPINLFNINIKFKNNNLYLNNYLYFHIIKLNNLIILKKLKNYLYILPIKNKFSYSIAGTFRSIINNIILGFINNYEKKLILIGIGYKVVLQFWFLYLYLGFSHPLIYKIPFDIKIIINSLTELTIFGFNKQKVNQVAYKIKSFKFPNLYKGNGIKYFNEKLIIKTIKKK